MWWTSQALAGRSQPPGQTQCLSLVMTARRMAGGMELAQPMSSGWDGVFQGLSSSPWRRTDAMAAGPETKSMARRAIA